MRILVKNNKKASGAAHWAARRVGAQGTQQRQQSKEHTASPASVQPIQFKSDVLLLRLFRRTAQTKASGAASAARREESVSSVSSVSSAASMSASTEGAEGARRISESGSETEVDVHFEPLVTLPEVELTTNEENEEVLIKLRAKLFRFDTKDRECSEWKERGTGEVKILRHKENNSARVVMRRDKTLKICANHFITPWMELKPSAGSNRAWVWTVPADFADELAKSECLAIRFATAEIAQQWREKFEEARNIVKTRCRLYADDEDNADADDADDTDDAADSGQSTPEKRQQPVDGQPDRVIEQLAQLNVSK